MVDQQRPTVRRRRLGRQLRHLREERGLSIPEAADLLNRDPSALSKVETGHRGLRRPALEYVLNQYGITDEALRQQLFALARDLYKKGWWQDYDQMLSPETMDLISLEADAILIEYFELILIPGLLQTEDYARALISSGRFSQTPERLDRLVGIRTKRQEILHRPDPPKLWAILDEAALCRQVGGPKVMRAQLQHLYELSWLPHVTLQVLPFAAGAYLGMSGPFQTLHVGARGELQVVVVDSLTKISYHEEEHEIHAYSETFDFLRATALSDTDSRALIEGLMSGT